MSTVEPEDPLLVRAIRGDERALEAILVRDSPSLRAQIADELRRCGIDRPSEVEEILPEVWSRLARGLGSFQPVGQAAWTAWRKKIAVNTTRSHVRRLKRSKEFPLPTVRNPSGDSMSVSLLAHLGLDTVTPSRVVVQDELEACLREALQDLQPRHRTAITLRVLQGLSVGESAQQMGCTAGQFRGYLQRGLENLRANPRLKELLY